MRALEIIGTTIVLPKYAVSADYRICLVAKWFACIVGSKLLSKTIPEALDASAESLAACMQNHRRDRSEWVPIIPRGTEKCRAIL